MFSGLQWIASCWISNYITLFKSLKNISLQLISFCYLINRIICFICVRFKVQHLLLFFCLDKRWSQGRVKGVQMVMISGHLTLLFFLFPPPFVTFLLPSRKWRTSRSWTSSVKMSSTLSPPKRPLTQTRKSHLFPCQVGFVELWWSRFHMSEHPVCYLLQFKPHPSHTAVLV